MRETMFISSIKSNSHPKWIFVEPISLYEEHLWYASVGNGPHCISIIAQILDALSFLVASIETL